MGKAVRSARGAVVDFDLLKIKEQLAGQPAPVSVADRREYIDVRDGLAKTRRTIPAAEVNAVEVQEVAEVTLAITPAKGSGAKVVTSSKKDTNNDEA